MKEILALIGIEGKAIRRDSTLLIFSFVPLLLLAIVRFGLPALFNAIHTPQLMTEHATFIASILLLMPPAMMGMAAGYLLLDDRDEDLLTYLDVTPLRRSGYLLFKTVAPVVVALVYGGIVLAGVGLVHISFLRALGVLLLAALEAPVVLFLMVAFAGNKVEGLAVGKALNMMSAAPFVVYFLPMPWSGLASIFPQAWVTRLVLAETPEQYLLAFSVGVAVHLAWIGLAYRLFKRRAR